MTECFIDCPECGLPAEIVDRFTFTGAPGPVEHVKLVCLAGHWFTPPVDFLASEHAVRDISERESKGRRIATHLKDGWAELDQAQRRIFKIRTGLDLDGR
jgi:hypothetical protein